MKEITLKIPEAKLGFFLELIRQLGFEVSDIEKDDNQSREEILTHIEDSVQELNQVLSGKAEARDGSARNIRRTAH